MIINMISGSNNPQQFDFSVSSNFTFDGSNYYSINDIDISGGLVRSFLLTHSEGYGVLDNSLRDIFRNPTFVPQFRTSGQMWAAYYHLNGSDFEQKIADGTSSQFEYDSETKTFKLKFALFETGLILLAGNYRLTVW